MSCTRILQCQVKHKRDFIFKILGIWKGMFDLVQELFERNLYKYILNLSVENSLINDISVQE